jgi:hypothetical protein
MMNRNRPLWLLFFCFTLIQCLSSAFAARFEHSGDIPGREIKEALEEIIEGAKEGRIEKITDNDQLLKVASTGSIFECSKYDKYNVLEQYCPQGYAYNQSGGCKSGRVYETSIKKKEIFGFELTKYSFINARTAPSQKNPFSVKIWYLTVFYLNENKDEEDFIYFENIEFNNKASFLEPKSFIYAKT